MNRPNGKSMKPISEKLLPGAVSGGSLMLPCGGLFVIVCYFFGRERFFLYFCADKHENSVFTERSP